MFHSACKERATLVNSEQGAEVRCAERTQCGHHAGFGRCTWHPKQQAVHAVGQVGSCCQRVDCFAHRVHNVRTVLRKASASHVIRSRRSATGALTHTDTGLVLVCGVVGPRKRSTHVQQHAVSLQRPTVPLGLALLDTGPHLRDFRLRGLHLLAQQPHVLHAS